VPACEKTGSCHWNTGFYLSRSLAAKQPGWLPNLGTDTGACVQHTTLWCQQFEAEPHWHVDRHITKRHRWSCWSMENTVTCKHEGERTWLGTSAELKLALFGASALYNWLFLEPPTVYQGKNIVLRHICRSYLKANKASKSEGTRKVEHAPVAFLKVCWCCLPKIIKVSL